MGDMIFIIFLPHAILCHIVQFLTHNLTDRMCTLKKILAKVSETFEMEKYFPIKK